MMCISLTHHFFYSPFFGYLWRFSLNIFPLCISLCSIHSMSHSCGKTKKACNTNSTLALHTYVSFIHASWGIRTPNRLIRSQELYPVEPRMLLIRTTTTGFHKGKPFTILGAEKLNGCVRYGNRWILLAIITVLICFLRYFVLSKLNSWFNAPQHRTFNPTFVG